MKPSTRDAERSLHALVLAAFRLGYDACRETEPKGAVAAEEPVELPRYIVQHVVVDTRDGRIVQQPLFQQDYAEAVAEVLDERVEQA